MINGVNNSLSLGNIAGGITTLEEKSLGAAGTAPRQQQVPIDPR